MKITDITAEELRLKRGEEGMVFQGCGGDTKEWVDGINKLLKDEKILTGGTRFKDCYRFENNGLTNLYFPFGNATLDMGKLPVWRLKAREVFGCMWLSDYVENYLGGFAPNSASAEILSKTPGTRTVLTGSVSRGRNEPSESL